MPLDNRRYKFRYMIENWDGPPAGDDLTGSVKVRNGIRASATNYGYTDDLLLMSVTKDEFGQPESILLLDSTDGPNPSRELLELARDQIEHHLRHHCPPA